jgi:predicted NBD/HSP70 family sugar kinase
MVRSAAIAHPEGLLARALSGWTTQGGEARVLGPALAEGDPNAHQILQDVADSMAYALSHAVHLLHPEVIVLSAILADPINTYLSEFKDGVLEEVDGSPVRTLADVATAFAKPADFHVLKFIGNGRPLVLERSVVDSARDRIRTRYGVRQEQLLETAAR